MRYMIKARGSNQKGINQKCTQVGGSKLINLYVAFECAFHIFACMSQISNLNIHACVVYASYMLD